MGFGRFSAYFRIATLAVCLTHPAAAASANDTAQITPFEQVQIDKWADIPPTFLLRGHITDDEDNPIRGAQIFIADGAEERELAKSGKGGVFEITELLSPSTRLIIRHRMFAPGYAVVGALYDGASRDVLIEIIPYTERFDVTPQGGTYTSGEMILEVPAGAISDPVTILAAQLPLDYSYNHDGRVESLRLTSVDLKPHGLTFEKPVTLIMTIAREDLANVIEPAGYYYDDGLQRYIRDPEAIVEVDGHRVALTFSHLSRYAVADGKMAQSTQALGRGSDVDGDGKLTPSDALFMLLTSGGVHKASARYAQVVAGSVMQERAGSGPGEAAATGASPDVKGPRFSRFRTLPHVEARDMAEKYSLGRRWEKTVTAALDVATDEYKFDCTMLLGRYEFHRGISWERVRPGPAEMAVIQAAWQARQRGRPSGVTPGTYEYFKWQGTDRPVIPRSLPGTQILALTIGSEGLEVFVKRHSHIIAGLRGAVTGPCPNRTELELWASADRAVADAHGRKARQDAMARKFHFGSNGSETTARAPWGTFSRDDLRVHTDMRCRSAAHQVWNYVFNPDDAGSTAQIWTTSSLPEPGTPGGLASSVEWWITNDSPSYLSEHLTAGLFKKTPDGLIPFGFMMYRTDERPCAALAATSPVHQTDPDEPTLTGPTLTRPQTGGPYGLASRD